MNPKHTFCVTLRLESLSYFVLAENAQEAFWEALEALGVDWDVKHCFDYAAVEVKLNADEFDRHLELLAEGVFIDKCNPEMLAFMARFLEARLDELLRFEAGNDALSADKGRLDAAEVTGTLALLRSGDAEDCASDVLACMARFLEAHRDAALATLAQADREVTR